MSGDTQGRLELVSTKSPVQHQPEAGHQAEPKGITSLFKLKLFNKPSKSAQPAPASPADTVEQVLTAENVIAQVRKAALFRGVSIIFYLKQMESASAQEIGNLQSKGIKECLDELNHLPGSTSQASQSAHKVLHTVLKFLNFSEYTAKRLDVLKENAGTEDDFKQLEKEVLTALQAATVSQDLDFAQHLAVLVKTVAQQARESVASVKLKAM